MEQAKAQEQSQRLTLSLQKIEPSKVLVWVATLALRRGCSLSPEELELRRDDLLNPRNYAVQLEGRDVVIEQQDFDEALHRLGTAPREQYEQAWPSLDLMIAAVLEAGKKRRIAESRSRSLGDGRRPGESELEQWKREADTDAPDADAQAIIDRLKAKMAMDKKPTQASTQTPQTSTSERKGSLRDMRPEYVNEVLTILNSLEKLATDETCGDYEIAMGLLRTVSERSTVAAVKGVLRVYWPDAAAERKAEAADATKPQ